MLNELGGGAADLVVVIILLTQANPLRGLQRERWGLLVCMTTCAA